MTSFVKAHSLSGTESGITINSLPEECPWCHHAVQPLFRYARFDTALPTSDDLHAQLVFQCPRKACKQLFFADYRFRNFPRERVTSDFLALRIFFFQSSYPTLPRAPNFPSEVEEISPRFVQIYQQAAEADARGLDQIAGPGYGKALEFLVKDWLITRSPTEAEAIRHEFLGAVIKNRVTAPQVKACASRATWLRNDETHYERRWEDKDLQDLKTLVQLTVNWIHSELLTAAVVASMPDPQKGG